MVALLVCASSLGLAAGALPGSASLPDPAAPLERFTRSQTPDPHPKSVAQSGQSWTILVYFSSDNNLWRSALRDIQEMEQVGSSSGFRVIVYVDGLPANQGGFDGTVYAQVGRATGGTPATWDGVRQNLQILQSLPEQNSDDPNTIATFINWGVRSFPAQHYGLVLWDHGGQWLGGFGQDKTNNGDGILTWDLRRAIRAGMAQSGLRSWDFFGFDTCLMGGLELLLEYADLTGLYIAGPESDYGDGWDYAGTLGALRNNPGMTMRQFGQTETAYYRQQHQRNLDDANEHAHAVYDTQYLQPLKNALNDFVRAAIQSGDRDSLVSARAEVVNYGYDSSDPNEFPLYVDLGQYAQLVANRTRSAPLAQAGQALTRAIADVLVATSIGPSKRGAQGLSVFLPNDPRHKIPDVYYDVYAQKLQSGAQVIWKDFLNLWLGKIAPSVQPIDLRVTQATNLLEPTDREPATVNFTVTGTATLIYAELGELSGRNGFRVYAQLYQQSGGAGEYSYGWDGRWYEIGSDGNTDTLSGYFQRPNDPIFYANASYTPPGEVNGFAVTVVTDLRRGKVINVLDNSSSSPRSIPVEPYGTLRFNYLERDQITDESTLVPTGRFVTVPRNGIDGLEITRNRAPLGEYILIFGARDAVGNIKTGFVPVQVR